MRIFGFYNPVARKSPFLGVRLVTENCSEQAPLVRDEKLLAKAYKTFSEGAKKETLYKIAESPKVRNLLLWNKQTTVKLLLN